MKITVDAAACSGHGRCYSLAPDVFDADESGFCRQRGTTFDLGEEHRASAELAAANCPECAIVVHGSDPGRPRLTTDRKDI